MKYFSLVLMGVATGLLVWRLVMRRLRFPEVILAGVVAAHTVVVMGFIFAERGFFPYWAWRYVQPADALTLCLIAVIVAPFCERFQRWKWWLVIAIFLAVMGRRDYKCCKVYWRMKACQDAVRASAEWAAELIRQDWKGPSREERTYDRREYYPARRPVVLEYFGQTLQAVGGRFPKVTWDEEDNQSVWPTEMPDYICLIEGDHAKYVDWYLANGGMIAARQTFNGLPFIFCKRAERECVHAVPTENERAAGRCITGGK